MHLEQHYPFRELGTATAGFNVLEQLQSHASGPRRDENYLTFMAGGAVADRCTYAEIWSRSSKVAAMLKDRDLVGKPVLILLPSGINYAATFFGCLIAGVIAVPIYPPANQFHLPRLDAIVNDSGAGVALTSSVERARIEALLGDHPTLLEMIEVDRLDGYSRTVNVPSCTDDAIAFLQYTSGSTGRPKGVMVSHKNLAHHAQIIDREALGDERGPIFSWLPLYHDLGLIGCLIQSAIWGDPFLFMAPASFLQRPLSWLQFISAHSALRSGGPNFAYDLCVQAFERRPVEGLDLTSWRVAFCGAEPIRPATFRRFAQCFEPHGFDPGAFMPGYGLAEATLYVSGSRREIASAEVTLDHADLEQGIVTPTDSESGRSFMSCGKTARELSVEIVDPELGDRVGPGKVGEIWVRGHTVTGGYWKNPELSDESFAARINGSATPFLRTGDLGFIKDDHLYVVGRAKDLIIIDGRNFHPCDIEERAQEASRWLRRDHVIAFALQGEQESLGIVGEVTRALQNDSQLHAELGSLARAIINATGTVPSVIGVVRPGKLPKTSSGKLKRREAQRMFFANEFEFLAKWTNQRAFSNV